MSRNPKNTIETKSSGTAPLLQRVWRRLKREVQHARERSRCQRRTTYPTDWNGRLLPGTLVPDAARSPDGVDRDQIISLAELYCGHRFDLLGSGWRSVGYKAGADDALAIDADGAWLAGRINRSNLAESQRIWRQVSPDYEPIDWQRDIKSGFRWSESMWQGDCPMGYVPGRDVKVPWELGRCQHFVTLAQAFALTCHVGYAEEFRNQVLDFLATNPPGYGVQWRCSMDVGIRIANWLTAWDMFRAFGHSFDAEFETLLARGAYAHAQHIVEHLEWTPETRGNHYLANVTGLLYATSCLSPSPEVDAWLAFAAAQFLSETDRQFLEDGGHFEASTSYHRLCSEMVVFGTAVLCSLSEEKRQSLVEVRRKLLPNGPAATVHPATDTASAEAIGETPVPASHFETIRRMIRFCEVVTKPDGRLHQIGDNDSGRFLKLDVAMTPMTVAEARERFENLSGFDELADDETYWWDDSLASGPLLGAGRALIEPEKPGSAFSWGAEFVRALLQRNEATSPIRCDSDRVQLEASSSRIRDHLERLAADSQLESVTGCIDLGSEVFASAPTLTRFPNFGLYVWRSPRLYFAVRCGQLSAGNTGGHAHCDQLAIEVQFEGRDILADPGSFLYTPDPEQRNRYRSVAVHTAPRAADGREPANLSSGLFRMLDTMEAECLYAGPDGFVGRHRGYGEWVYRVVELAGDRVLISDFGAPHLGLQPPPELHIDALPASLVLFSPGYGLQERGTARHDRISPSCRRRMQGRIVDAA
ncbi:Heparinase II/III-like protein [Maioricimonas rarisocia]|uniref:Heparinase II/III-like protein n=1 Tax=Maioricimonas rarisocia TaxID=2528026 RepID=A0A517ZC46_9PLAN|nr:heparinase II/III family protein [Maioricimonas rarisocia]QDU40073.1 Heparinase II/III-like protein [Maioricimonas rarisocia]